MTYKNLDPSFPPAVREWLVKTAESDSKLMLPSGSEQPGSRSIFAWLGPKAEDPDLVEKVRVEVKAREDKGVLRVVDPNLLPKDVEVTPADRVRLLAAVGAVEEKPFVVEEQLRPQIIGFAVSLPAVPLGIVAASIYTGPFLPFVGALGGAALFATLGSLYARFDRVKEEETREVARLEKIAKSAWVTFDLSALDTVEGVAATVAVLSGEGVLASPAYSSSLLDTQRVRLNVAEEVRQTVLSASRIARTEAEIDETEKILTSPEAARAIAMQRETLEAGRRSVANRANELRNYALAIMQLEGQLRELEALTKLENTSENIDVILRGIFTDEEAAKHLANLSAETRAIADGVRDTVALLAGPTEVLRAISERNPSR